MPNFWKDAILQFWGIDAHLTQLVGESDLNFKAHARNGSDLLLKVMHIGCPESLVDMQCQALAYLERTAPQLPVPRILPTQEGALFATTEDENGNERFVWAIEYMPGQHYAEVEPQSLSLAANLGKQLARLDNALANFKHPELHRSFAWHLMQADWIESQISVIEQPNRVALITSIYQDYRRLRPQLETLPSQPIHNDINDYNLLVEVTLSKPASISGFIDFGDMCSAPRVCEVAIAAAYSVLDHADPIAVLEEFVAAYHKESPLTGPEIDAIYALLRMRLAVSLVTSSKAAKTRPNDQYAVISQAPAWRFLESEQPPAALISGRLRVACGLPVSDSAPELTEFLEQQRGKFKPIMPLDFSRHEMVAMSLSESNFPSNPMHLSIQEAQTMGVSLKPDVTQIGYYAEPRLIYSSAAFRSAASAISDRRTVHLGLDIFAAPMTPICSPLEAVVLEVCEQADYLDYGGLVILEHRLPSNTPFYSLWGHLNPNVIDSLKRGQKLAAGDQFALLGAESENGGWAPHLHLQLALTTTGLESGWPGVANPDERSFWTALCPNPAALIGLEDKTTCYMALDETQIKQDRDALFGRNLALSYQQPAMFLRGYQHYLFDQWGRTYLDAYNNVPHVGHAHKRIQQVATEQLGKLNSNTRYLHPAPNQLAKKLRSKLPKQLTTCYFVNSGSEANELALRLARAHTGGKDMITLDHGYHGNTTGAIDISAYKFNANGGVGQADWVHLIDAPDSYRGRYLGNNAEAASGYAEQVDSAIKSIRQRGARLAGFIAETYPSVGGQIIPPDHYYSQVYAKVRASGGVCIADEVQTGLGRLGEYYFAFEQQGVIPDIVVLGKPIANGHPMGIVITTQAIADSFAQGPEFFSTFGGSTLSCRLALEVLQIVDDEGLQENARLVGSRLLSGLRDLQQRHACIGDVRGIGLFVGVELTNDPHARTPSAPIARYVVNRLREQRILIGLEGPDHNILKIRPPLTIKLDDVEVLLQQLDAVLSETAVVMSSSN